MEWDPLIRGNTKFGLKFESTSSVRGGGFQRFHRFALFVWPTLHFIVAISLCCYALHDHFYICSGSMIAMVSLNVFMGMLLEKAVYRECGVLGTVATGAGCGLGVLLYCYLMIFFFGYRDLRTFTDVIGTQKPEQFADAGMLAFSHTTSVDDTRAVGLKSFEDGGVMFCLAPIIDSSMTATDTVSFWAVGTDCCDSRGKFFCGDSHVPGAYSGVVILRPEMFVSPGMEWMMRIHQNMLAHYEKAVRLASDVFTIQVPSDSSSNVFVEWSSSPHKIQESFKNRADMYSATAIIFAAGFFGLQASMKKAEQNIQGMSELVI